MTAPRRAVVIMAKRPDPATTKTRLHPILAPVVAAQLYECFLLDTIDLVAQLDDIALVIAMHPAEAAEYAASIAPHARVLVQEGPDLGHRLDHVLSTLLADGFHHVAAISSDSPTLPGSQLKRAFALLEEPDNDVVLGPAADGGYYLIGVCRPPGKLVTAVTMSTPRVLDDTLAAADQLGLRVELLDPWYDVDEPDDLKRLRHELLPDEQVGSGDSSATGATAARTRAFLAERATSVAAVIPALDEEGNIAEVVRRTATQNVDTVIVVDNGSSDGTSAVAEAAGAVVITEPRRGYGYACAAGAAEAARRGADVVAFLDGDLSSPPEELAAVLTPVVAGDADLVLGSRVLGHIDRRAMSPHQRFGNALSAALMRRLYGLSVTDLGPFRAIRTELLLSLGMQEMTFGWPTEMTVKSARANARIIEVPVSWLRRNAGASKVSGTLRGSVLAARHILGVTIRYSLRR